MPKIYEYFGLVFLFYSNEHEPVHVHATSGGTQTIFDIYFENGEVKEIRQRKKRGIDHLPPAKRKEAEKFVRAYAKKISQKWYETFVLNIDLKCETITERI